MFDCEECVSKISLLTIVVIIRYLVLKRLYLIVEDKNRSESGLEKHKGLLYMPEQ
jgi:hypothetical protein